MARRAGGLGIPAPLLLMLSSGGLTHVAEAAARRRCRCSSRARPPAPSRPPSSARADSGGQSARLRHGRHHRQALARRRRRAAHRVQLRGRAPEALHRGQRPADPHLDHRADRDRRGRRQHRARRRDRPAQGRPAQRGLAARARPPTASAARSRRSPTPTSCSAISTPTTSRAARCAVDLGGGAAAVEAAGAARSGSSPTKVAWGIHDIVNENMASAARVHIAERGRDPRDYALLCTGGAGPGARLSRSRASSGISRVICPPSAGVASALGLLVAPARVDRVATVGHPPRRGQHRALEAAFRTARGRGAGGDGGHRASSSRRATVQRLADGRFLGQGFDLVVPLPDGPYDDSGPGARARSRRPSRPRTARSSRSRRPTCRSSSSTSASPCARPSRAATSCSQGGAAGARGRRSRARAPRVLPRGGRLRRDGGLRPLPPRRRRRARRARGRGGGRLDARRRARRDRARAPPSGNLVISLRSTGPAHEPSPASTPSRWRCCGRASSRSWTRRPRPSCAPRSPRSSNEANDFACVLTDARGHALAQNTGSIPSFIGTLPATVRHFLREMGADGMRPGRRAHHQQPVDGHRAPERRLPGQADLPRRTGSSPSPPPPRTCPTSAGASAPSRRARCSRRASTSRSRSSCARGSPTRR